MADRGEWDDADVICEVPIELLFTDLDVISSQSVHLIERFTDAWYEHHLQYSNISIMRFTPHRELYRYLMGLSGSAAAYQDWYDKIYSTRGLAPPMVPDKLLLQRRMEFINMNNELSVQSSFYRDHPIEASYNPSGYFNIKDGHHRAAFLYCRGFRRVFVKMSASDHRHWRNDQQAAAVQSLIERQQRRLIYTPILNPAFYDWNSERDEVYPSRLDIILQYLGPYSLQGTRVIDIGCNIGYHARCFTREGAKVTGVEHDPNHVEMLNELNRLERTWFDVVPLPFQQAEVGKYDIGVLLTVLYHIMKDEEECRAFLRKIDASVEHLLFWESGDEIEAEKRLLLANTGFLYYEKLADTAGTGKYRELGVFLK